MQAVIRDDYEPARQGLRLAIRSRAFAARSHPLPVLAQNLKPMLSPERQADLVALKQLIEAGRVISALDRTYSQSETQAAIDYVAGGHAHGKVVITI